MSPERERRRAGHIRLPVRIPVLAEQGRPAGMPSRGETQNLSGSGVLLLLGQEGIPGAPIRVTLHLRRPISLSLTGTVVWTRPHPDLSGWDLGIQFTEELSRDFVAEIADEEFPPGTTRTH